MSQATNSLESQGATFERLLDAASAAEASRRDLLAEARQFAREARRGHRADIAVPILERLVELAPDDAASQLELGFAYAAEQRIPEAVPAFRRASELAPGDPESALAYARSSLDSGGPSVPLFERVLQLKPGNLAAIRGQAAALAAERREDAAEALLCDALTQQPDWLEGHDALATLRFTQGDTQHFARSYAEACRTAPRNLALRMAWFGLLVQARDWPRALEIIAEGEALIGTCAVFSAARTLVVSESDDRAGAEALFAKNAALRDDALGIAHVRHCLRAQQLDKAEALALGLLERPVAPAVWPYLAAIWRARGDSRAQWLDGAPPSIRVIDLDWSHAELEKLAAVLRRLHTARTPRLEQSVREGTQTDQQLFYRAEPEIQALRNRVCAAVRDYVAELPAEVRGHPLLGAPREQILFSGSWSVRLRSGGFHVSHTHPKGWISSALYVSVPQPDQLGAAPAGWIRFGVPPPRLGLDLPAYRQVEPKPGRLVLFPSTMWHDTMPFEDGERLVVAFDVMRPHH